MNYYTKNLTFILRLHNHPHSILLLPHLQHLPVGIRMHLARERRAARRAVLWAKPPRLVPHPTRITQGLGSMRTRPPLRGLISPAMQAFPPDIQLAGTATTPAGFAALNGGLVPKELLRGNLAPSPAAFGSCSVRRL